MAQWSQPFAQNFVQTIHPVISDVYLVLVLVLELYSSTSLRYLYLYLYSYLSSMYLLTCVQTTGYTALYECFYISARMLDNAR